jgi:uncharacterized protein (TIRG00374 family)
MFKNSDAKPTPNYKKALVYALQVMVIGLLALYLYQNQASLSALVNIRWQHIVGIILLDTAGYAINSFINYYLTKRLDPRVGLLDSFMLQYVNSLLNKILPTIGGGAAYRAYYLKKVYDFPYTQFVSTVASLYVISFSMTSFIGLFCLLLIYWNFHVFNWVIFLAFTGILTPTMIIILFSPKIPPSRHRLLKILKDTTDSWYILKKDTKLVLVCLLLSSLQLFVAAAYAYVGYAAIGVEPSFVAMLYLSTLGIIMAFLNFTPDGIGVKEGIYIFSKDLVQIPQALLVLGSLYLRGISMVTTFLIAAISYWELTRRLRKVEMAQAIHHGTADSL